MISEMSDDRPDQASMTPVSPDEPVATSFGEEVSQEAFDAGDQSSEIGEAERKEWLREILDESVVVVDGWITANELPSERADIQRGYGKMSNVQVREPSDLGDLVNIPGGLQARRDDAADFSRSVEGAEAVKANLLSQGVMEWVLIARLPEGAPRSPNAKSPHQDEDTSVILYTCTANVNERNPSRTEERKRKIVDDWTEEGLIGDSVEDRWTVSAAMSANLTPRGRIDKLDIKIYLPDSLADKLYAAAKENPQLMREALDVAVVEVVGADETWEGREGHKDKKLRPIYETWERDLGFLGEPRMAFSDFTPEAREDPNREQIIPIQGSPEVEAPVEEGADDMAVSEQGEVSEFLTNERFWEIIRESRYVAHATRGVGQRILTNLPVSRIGRRGEDLVHGLDGFRATAEIEEAFTDAGISEVVTITEAGEFQFNHDQPVMDMVGDSLHGEPIYVVDYATLTSQPPQRYPYHENGIYHQPPTERTRGRPISLNWTMLLPQSMAEELRTAIEADPELVRIISEGLLINPDATDHVGREMNDFTVEIWENCRPPYEEWQAINGGVDRIALRDSQSQGPDEARILEFVTE